MSGDLSSWGDAERIAVNVSALYCEYAGKLDTPDDPIALFTLLQEVSDAQRANL